MNYPTWYSLWCPREKRLFESPKLLVPDICQRSEFTVDHDGGIYIPNSAYGVVPKHNTEDHRNYLVAVLNSTAVWFYIYHTSPVLRGDYRRFMTSYLTRVPIPGYEPGDSGPDEFEEWFEAALAGGEIEHEGDHVLIARLGERNLQHHDKRAELNLSLPDHLGTYSDGPTLADVGLTQPPENAADSILQQTTDERPNLRVGRAEVVRESDSTVEIRLTARYKPAESGAHDGRDPDALDTDQWGYAETDPLPALRITDLASAEADLVEHFVPHAVEEGGGYANFRETATTTNSLVDRLRKLTLPRIADVREGLESYIETRARASELDERIARTDDLIDEIVYDLYGLSEEERAVVEDAVSD